MATTTCGHLPAFAHDQAVARLLLARWGHVCLAFLNSDTHLLGHRQGSDERGHEGKDDSETHIGVRREHVCSERVGGVRSVRSVCAL
jgi:hypothetical protein